MKGDMVSGEAVDSDVKFFGVERVMLIQAFGSCWRVRFGCWQTKARFCLFPLTLITCVGLDAQSGGQTAHGVKVDQSISR